MTNPMGKHPQAAAAAKLSASWAKAAMSAAKVADESDGVSPSTKTAMHKALQAMRQAMAKAK